MSQAVNKEVASKAFHIVGIYNADLEATEKQFVFVSKERAQKMLKLGDGHFGNRHNPAGNRKRGRNGQTARKGPPGRL